MLVLGGWHRGVLYTPVVVDVEDAEVSHGPDALGDLVKVVAREGERGQPHQRLPLLRQVLLSHNVLIAWFQKVNSPMKSSTYCHIEQNVDDFVGELTLS